jgi:Domain of unknown function (DUF892)
MRLTCRSATPIFPQLSYWRRTPRLPAEGDPSGGCLAQSVESARAPCRSPLSPFVAIPARNSSHGSVLGNANSPPPSRESKMAEKDLSALFLDYAQRHLLRDAIEGIIEEGKEIMDESKGSAALDLGLLAAAQAVEHYEIARYGTLKAWAEKISMPEAAKLIDETLTKKDRRHVEQARGPCHQCGSGMRRGCAAPRSASCPSSPPRTAPPELARHMAPSVAAPPSSLAKRPSQSDTDSACHEEERDPSSRVPNQHFERRRRIWEFSPRT